MFTDLLRIFFPSDCVSCRKSLFKGEHFLCSSCELLLPYRELNADLKGKLTIDHVNHVYALLNFSKKGITQSVLHEIKYKDNLKLAHHFGSMTHKLVNANYDLILPVPLHPKKERKRGYNQALELAKGLSSISSIPINKSSLKKVKHTQTQTKKNKTGRMANVLDLFECSKINASKIILIDDVVTTGSTLNECVKTIKKNNPSIEIDILCLAYASL